VSRWSVQRAVSEPTCVAWT